MAFDYGRSQVTADRLLSRFGQAATLSRPTSTGPTYNPAPGAPDDYPVRIAVMEYANNEIDGARVLATDKKVYLSAYGLTVEPQTSDVLVIGASEHKIASVKPLNPAGTAVYFELQVRR